MSDDEIKYDTVDVEIRSWVNAAKITPELYRDRQVTEIVLAAQLD